MYFFLIFALKIDVFLAERRCLHPNVKVAHLLLTLTSRHLRLKYHKRRFDIFSERAQRFDIIRDYTFYFLCLKINLYLCCQRCVDLFLFQLVDIGRM